MCNLQSFVESCAKSMNEAFFGREIDYRRPTAPEDRRNKGYEGVSALDLICEYIFNNLENLITKRSFSHAEGGKMYYPEDGYQFRIDGRDKKGYFKISFVTEEGSAEEAAKQIVLTKEFNDRLHDILRNAVYTERKKEHRFLYHGTPTASLVKPIVASVANLFDHEFTIEYGEFGLVNIKFESHDFYVSDTARGSMFTDDGEIAYGRGEIDSSMNADFNRLNFKLTKPNLPA